MSDPSGFAKAYANFAGTREAFKVAIVAPVHIQPSEQWIQALNVAARSATIIIVDDSNGRVKLPENWDVYDYARQQEALGSEMYERWGMFQHSSACKQFGLWLAHQRGFDPIIVIDSDCIIPPDFVAKHIEQLIQFGDGWENPIDGSGFYSRGFPYHERKKPVWAHMGLWEHELDLYGTDRVGQSFIPSRAPLVDRKVSAGMFPLSGMNVSFRNDAVPYMLFLPNFRSGEERFTRHDDIWGGYIFQKLARARGFVLSYGNPVVYHDTVVVPEEDAADEEAMIRHEEEFYAFIDCALESADWWELEDPRPWRVFQELARHLEDIDVMSPFMELLPAFRFAADFLRIQDEKLSA